MHNYNDVHGSLPPGYIYQQNNYAVATTTSTSSMWSWGALILPFLEQNSLYDKLQVGDVRLYTALSTPAMLAEMQKPIPTFMCPSDTGLSINTQDQLRNGSGAFVSTAKSNYSGLNTTRRWHSGGLFCGPDANEISQWSGNADPLLARPQDNTRPNGLFFRNRGVPFRDIVDGTSNVIMLGEKAFELQVGNGTKVICRAGAIFGELAENEQTNIHRSLATLTYRINSFGTNACIFGFSSPHDGGVQYVFADGAVRFISENIDHSPSREGGTDAVDSTFEKLGSRDDGQSVGDF